MTAGCLDDLQLIRLVVATRAIRRKHPTQSDSRRHDLVDAARAVLLAGNNVLIVVLADCAASDHPGKDRITAMANVPFAHELLEFARGWGRAGRWPA